MTVPTSGLQVYRRRASLRLGFDLIVFAVFAVAAVGALDFPLLAQYFPLYVGILGAALALAIFAVDARATFLTIRAYSRAGAIPPPAPPDGESAADTRRVLYYAGWILFFVVLLLALGMEIASWIYIYLFLTYEARAGLKLRLAGPTLVVLGVVVLDLALATVEWPSSLIFPW